MVDPKFIYGYGNPRDCTDYYNIDFNEPCSFDDFVQWIFKNKADEFGTITVCIWPKLRPDFQLEYSRGQFISDTSEYESFKNLQIRSANCLGGWYRMNYEIFLTKSEEDK